MDTPTASTKPKGCTQGTKRPASSGENNPDSNLKHANTGANSQHANSNTRPALANNDNAKALQVTAMDELMQKFTEMEGQ
jgi:3-deoxy-D-manno-octulosonic acid (KDO) 8-phosphate synthase